MGWTTLPEVQTPEQLQQAIRALGYQVLDAHCCFENGYQVLWTVEVLDNGERGIICTLIKTAGNGIACKDMWEALHPYYYSCPLHFLAMTEQSPLRCDKWREQVKAWHATKAPETSH